MQGKQEQDSTERISGLFDDRFPLTRLRTTYCNHSFVVVVVIVDLAPSAVIEGLYTLHDTDCEDAHL